MKAVKELYGKKNGKEDRRPRYILCFDFIDGSTTIQRVGKIIPESSWNG